MIERLYSLQVVSDVRNVATLSCESVELSICVQL